MYAQPSIAPLLTVLHLCVHVVLSRCPFDRVETPAPKGAASNLPPNRLLMDYIGGEPSKANAKACMQTTLCMQLVV
jgi:hypothetical protein